MSTVHLSATDRPPPVGGPVRKTFKKLLLSTLALKCTSLPDPLPDLRSFYKPGSKKLGLKIWVPIPIQWYKNMPGHDAVHLCLLHIFC